MCVNCEGRQSWRLRGSEVGDWGFVKEWQGEVDVGNGRDNSIDLFHN